MSAGPWPALLAQLNLSEPLFWAIRFVAGVGGAFIGWFVTDPLTRVTYRLLAKKPVPVWVLPWTKMAGAAGLGLLVFFFIPLGEGGGGLGWGPGQGGSPGKGAGTGGDGAAKTQPTKDARDAKAKDGKGPPKAAREIVEVELLGGARYPGKGEYYLIGRKDPPRTLAEVEEYLKKNQGRVEVHLVLTEQSVGRRHEAYRRLRALLNQYAVPAVEPPEPEPTAAKD